MTSLEYLEHLDPEPIMFDGLDAAIIGVMDRFGTPSVVLYDVDKVIGLLMDRDGMSHEEAVEFFEFNIIGAFVGETTPAFARLF